MNTQIFTHYKLNPEHGITGNLAQTPEFGETKSGKPCAKLAIYCSPKKPETQGGSNASNHSTIELIANVLVLDQGLFKALEELNKGDFINFGCDSINVLLSENGEAGKRYSRLSFIANDFKLLYRSRHAYQQTRQNSDAAHGGTTRRHAGKKKAGHDNRYRGNTNDGHTSHAAHYG